MKRILFVVTEDWYFVSHRLHLAVSALRSGYEVGVLCNLTGAEAEIRRAGVKVLPWRLERRSRNPLTELRSVLDVRRAIRTFGPDIVHAVALKPVVYTALASLGLSHGRVAALGGLGFVFSSDRPLARSLRPFVRAAYRAAMSGVRTRVILQNLDDVSVVVGAGVVPASRIRLIRGAGVETEKFVPQPEPGGVPLVVLPARMLWSKGVREFVDAARLVRRRGVAGRFALVGDRDEHNPDCVPLSDLQAWQAAGTVEWWGRRSDMPEVLAGCSAVCLPSHREGLPKSLLEAASCARPIVTFDVPGCREVVTDGMNGRLVRFGAIEALAGALADLLSDPALRRRMGAAGRERVVREFSEQRVAEATMRVWEEVMTSTLATS